MDVSTDPRLKGRFDNAHTAIAYAKRWQDRFADGDWKHSELEASGQLGAASGHIENLIAVLEGLMSAAEQTIADFGFTDDDSSGPESERASLGCARATGAPSSSAAAGGLGATSHDPFHDPEFEWAKRMEQAMDDEGVR